MGRNVQYLCERYDMNSHDFLNYSPSDINWRINKYYQGTIDQQTHTLAQLIFELVMVNGLCLIATSQRMTYLLLLNTYDQLYSPSGRQIQQNEYRKINNK